ncbi:MAG: HlyD family secretion protein [Gemmatimonadales bacterium]
MRRAMWLLPLLFIGCDRQPSGVTAQGTIEVEESDVVPLVGGRLVRLWVSEGEMVRAGDTVATLWSSTLPDDLRQREAKVAEAQAALTDLERGARPEEISRAEAEWKAAIADDSAAAAELNRQEALLVSRTSAQRDVDRARARAATAHGLRESKAQTLALLRAGATRETLDAARSRLAQARAELAEGLATEGELTLVAPSDGVVLPLYFKVGEVVSAGQPILTLADVARPWIRVYINQRDLPEIRLGQAAAARLDGDPEHPIAGRVVAINHEAEYTPRVALTMEERADLMFGVKIALTDFDGQVRAGLPATVELPRSGGPVKVAGSRS